MQAQPPMDEQDIIVLGVGNTLMQDDGLGVIAVRALAEKFALPDNVRLIDAGIAGFAWLNELSAAQHLLIVDAVRRTDFAPGSLCRLTGDDLAARQGPTISPHEIGVVEVIQMAEMLGQRPNIVILGMQPAISDKPGLELSPQINQALPLLIESVAAELRDLGCHVVEKSC